jgi:MFS family permease
MLTPAPARRAVSAIFFLNGVVLASWVAHIPAVKALHGLGDDRLGLVLLAMAVGAVSALPLAAWLIARWGSRCITSVASLGFCLALPLPVVAPNTWLVAAALAVFGAMNALLDVSMNAQAVMVEDRCHRPIMPAFHALFSTGGVVGALVASASMAGGLGTAGHVGLVTAVSLAVLSSALRRLLPPGEHVTSAGPVFAWPRSDLLSLALLTFCGLLVEGAMGDWSAVYLRDSLHTTAATAAGGFAAFSLTMAAGRLGGSFLADRLGGARLLRCSGAVAATGLGFALLVATPWSALIGFGLVGLGLANVIPIVFSAAGRVPGVPAGTALAAVATTGYAAYLAGPPIIGLAAGVARLPTALAIVVACCVMIAAQANALPASVLRTEVKGRPVADVL